MLTKDFPDEKILAYIRTQKQSTKEREEQNAPNNIYKGYAYINEERVVFKTIKLLKSKLTIIAPEEFVLSEVQLDSGVGLDSGPEQTALSNYDKTINIFLDLRHADNNESSHNAAFQSDQSAICDRVTLSEQGEEIHYCQTTTDTEHNKIHNLTFYIDTETHKLKGKIECIDYRLNDWKEIIYQMMKSIAILE